jgi:hypothetical protein
MDDSTDIDELLEDDGRSDPIFAARDRVDPLDETVVNPVLDELVAPDLLFPAGLDDEEEN